MTVPLRWHRASEDEIRKSGHTWLPRPLTPMSRRDEAIFLLHTAAEVEHALLVQYLYAAYSLAAPDSVSNPEHQRLLADWYRTINAIARQEMGHLATVQNLLLALGGPLNFEREDFPFRTDLYPFHLRLERISRDSLAKYVIAEMPPMSTIPRDQRRHLRHIHRRATKANRTTDVNRVGALYARIGQVIASLVPRDFRFDSVDRWQALPAHFGFAGPEDPDVLKKSFVIPVDSQASAINAVNLVATQGEGHACASGESHYDAFLKIYNDFPETDPIYGPAEWVASIPVPTDPFIKDPSRTGDDGRYNRLTARGTVLVAQLANLRYRITLTLLTHYFHIDAKCTGCGDVRREVAQWAKEEMKQSLGVLPLGLALMDRQDPNISIDGVPAVAGIPFEMPYTLTMPGRPSDRWRLLHSLMVASRKLFRRIKRVPNIDEQIVELVDLIRALDDGRMPTVRKMIRTDDC